MADPDGWWNLHRVVLSTDEVTCVLPMPEECAGALWRIGATWFAVAGENVVLRHGVGARQLALWSPASGDLRDLAPRWTDFGWSIWADEQRTVVVGGAEHEPTGVLEVPLDGGPPFRLTPPPVEDPYRSVPERRVADGVHYVYYPPRNPAASAPPGSKPPLLVTVHGGPTGHTDGTPSTELSLFTSRGFAVASVDYGGSTGYGRAYRERLRHKWGVVDIADCITVVRALREAIDPARVAIRGDSAGGWTTLAALARSDVFCAGAAYYPIADATRWSHEHTHDFESRYLDGLIRPADRERVSPLHHADRITSPLLLLQGVEDTICPPEHVESIAAAVRAPWHRLLLFEGEGHGFRKASSVTDSLRAEADLYRYAMRIDIADVG
jgi:dienelactone hydrolase